MVTETQKRIEAYQNLLPGIREKVTAVALLLALSVIMLTSASFAWLTISRAPEVSSVTTNIAANGSLEIALVSTQSDEEGNVVIVQPEESAVGDSMAKQDVRLANITWGNLINLGDPSYGLDKIVLRPAQLNERNLNTIPLSSAVFTEDGRVERLDNNFRYAKWHMPEDDKPGYFEITDEFGIRAISSVTFTDIGGEAAATLKYNELLTLTTSFNDKAASEYQKLENSEYMGPLTEIVSVYAQGYLDNVDNPVVTEVQIDSLITTYEQFIRALDAEAEAIAACINFQYYLAREEETAYTKDLVYAMTSEDINKLTNDGIQIKNINEFITDHATILADKATLESYVGDKTFNDIEAMVDRLISISTVKIDGKNVDKFVSDIIASIKANILGAFGILNDTFDVRIQEGILKRFENRTGERINVNTTIKIKYIIEANPKVNIQTVADSNYFSEDMDYADGLYQEGLSSGRFEDLQATAGDTFGLAVDFWVRTNASNSHLILEGKTIYDTEGREVVLQTKDAEGNLVDVYSVTRMQEVEYEGTKVEMGVEHRIYESNAVLWFDSTDPDTEIVLKNGEIPLKTNNKVTIGNEEFDVYTITRTVNGVETEYNIYQKETTAWFNVEDNMRFVLEPGEEENKKLVKTMVYDVVGYEGENRVWDEETINNALITQGNLTTQGMGSCYVYYADTPEDQQQSLELLKSLYVVFADANGEKLATAFMDTEKAYEDNGRVTVPLVLDPKDSDYLGTEDEKDIHGITALNQNEATLITAIIYLEGTNLGNDDVLAASNIQGQLNIQFGSSHSLVPVEDEELLNSVISISASVTEDELNYDTNNLTTGVEVNISGIEPETVEAFFLRSINGNQGSREDTMTFTKESDGKWVSSYTFDAPGNYVLRTVIVDGQEYILEDVPAVTVAGFTVEDVKYIHTVEKNISILTAEDSYKVDLSVKFASNDESKMPRTVQGRFFKSGASVTVDFKYNPTSGSWEGSGSFTTSGEYTLESLVLDGEYFGLEANKRLSANVKLGMKVKIETSSPLSFKADPDIMTDDQKLLRLRVRIMDNTGAELEGLTGAKLYYRNQRAGTDPLDTNLTWNGSYYDGYLQSVGAPFGVWRFSEVRVSGNTISKATESPEFTFISPYSPEYKGHTTPADQYAGYNDTYMTATVSNSDAAAGIQAYIIKEGASEGQWVDFDEERSEAVEGTQNNNWVFAVPGQEEGTWNLTRLKLWGVYVGDIMYTENSPLYIDVEEEAGERENSTYVYKTVDVVVEDYSGTRDFNGVAFQTHPVSASAFKVTFVHKKTNGERITYDSTIIKEPKLTFEYVKGTSEEKGGYTNSEFETNGYSFGVDLNHKGSGVFENLSTSFVYAGEYKTTLTYTVAGDKTYTISSSDANGEGTKLPEFTVSSVKPTVEIESISPSGSHTSASSNGDRTVTSAITSDKKSATVYPKSKCKYTYIIFVGNVLTGATVEEVPKVTLKLDGIGNANVATLVFTTTDNNGRVYMYTGDNNVGETNAFTWNRGESTCQRYISNINRQDCGGSTFAGTLTSESNITLKYGDMEFVVATDVITIISNSPT